MLMDDRDRGRVIFLNGSASAGKTTPARVIQGLIRWP
jgi:chloramphenicol 3-O-phosphotransferase